MISMNIASKWAGLKKPKVVMRYRLVAWKDRVPAVEVSSGRTAIYYGIDTFRSMFPGLIPSEKVQDYEL